MLKEEQQKRVEELRYKFRTEGSPVSDIIAIIDTLQAELDKPTAETYERFINKYLYDGIRSRQRVAPHRLGWVPSKRIYRC